MRGGPLNGRYPISRLWRPGPFPPLCRGRPELPQRSNSKPARGPPQRRCGRLVTTARHWGSIRAMGEVFLLAIRWLHTIAAVTWVGGAIFYWVVVRPTLRSDHPNSILARFAAPEFGQLVRVSIWILVLTGGILAVDALSRETGTVAYASVLAVKVALAGWMFLVIAARRRRPVAPADRGQGLRRWWGLLGHTNATVVLGLAILVLSDLLRWLVQQELAG